MPSKEKPQDLNWINSTTQGLTTLVTQTINKLRQENFPHLHIPPNRSMSPTQLPELLPSAPHLPALRPLSPQAPPWERATRRRQRREVSTRSFMRHQIYILIYKEEKRQCLNPSSSPYSPSRCRTPAPPGHTGPGPSYSQDLSVCLLLQPMAERGEGGRS